MNRSDFEKGFARAYGIISLILGIVVLVAFILFALKLKDYSSLILFCDLVLSSFLISKGVGLAFLDDELSEDIIIDENTTVNSMKSDDFLKRKMITFYIISGFMFALMVYGFFYGLLGYEVVTLNIFIGFASLVVGTILFFIGRSAYLELKKRHKKDQPSEKDKEEELEEKLEKALEEAEKEAQAKEVKTEETKTEEEKEEAKSEEDKKEEIAVSTESEQTEIKQENDSESTENVEAKNDGGTQK